MGIAGPQNKQEGRKGRYVHAKVAKGLFLVVAMVAALMLGGCTRTTPTEAKAIALAKNDSTAYTLPPEKLTKAHEITHLYDTLYVVGTAWGILSLWLILQLGVAARLRTIAVNWTGKRWRQCLLFVFLFFTLTTVLRLPLSIYGHRAALAFGFSVQGWGSWAADQGKSFLLNYALELVFVMLLFTVIRRFPRRWWLALWVPTMAMVLFGVYLTPLVIDPMYHQFTPLSQADPALVAQIERVAAHGGLDIPPERIFLMKASEKTTLLNAYVTGFGGSKRLVIWDTLLTKATPDEILLISGHEMGHYVLGHIVRGIFLAYFGILAAFFFGFHMFQAMLRRYGPGWGIDGQDDWAALGIVLLIFSVMSFVAQPVNNVISRSMEHDADVFGQESVHGIVADPQRSGQATEQMLGESQDSDPNPPALMEFWTDSHPSTAFRAAFAKAYDPWAAGEAPKFFRK